MKIITKLLKIAAGIAAFVVVLLLGGGLLLNTDTFQNKLLNMSTQMLSEKLETKVTIDSVSVNLFTQSLRLSGVCIEDRQQRKMLQLSKLAVSMELLPLLSNEVRISSAKIAGLRAELYKPSPDEPANFQFVIDAFKKEKTDSTAVAEKPKEKKKLALDVKKLIVERVSVKYNDNEASLQRITYSTSLTGKREGTLAGLQAQWVAQTKKGPQDCKAGIQQLTINEKGSNLLVAINGLRFANDNHLPRKNKIKPKRGAFDAGHIDAVANLRLTVSMMENDSLRATLDHCEAKDATVGIHVKDITLHLAANKEVLNLSNVDISLDNTKVHFDNGSLRLPSKKRGITLAYSTSTITGKTLLKDIAAPFAPPLKNFTEPLEFSTYMTGDDNSIAFHNISVKTSDGKLTISAKGRIKELKDKYKLDVRFYVDKMHARRGVIERIINQISVKKFMMKQLDNLGDVYYKGEFAVLWKKEQFQGLLTTNVGRLNFFFALDENNKYVNGTINTTDLELGRAFDFDDLGKVVCNAKFTFDFSKPRTAKMRKLKGGKLPIGNVSAHIDETSFKMIKFRNVQADIVSDGAVAEGKVNIRGKRTDLLCSFSFTNTDSIKKKLKVKPGIRFHGLTDEYKEKRELKREQKRQEKEARRQQAEKEKAIKKEEKEYKKALRDAEKAAKKAQREAAKAQREAEKAAKKAQHEAEKAAKKAEKEAKKAANQQNLI